MQVKNNREHSNVQLNAYVNKGDIVKYRDPLTGAQLSKPAKPSYKLIHIPPLATVEIDDELWLAATNGFTTIKVMEEIHEPIKELNIGKDKVATKSVLMPTGETKRVNLIEEMVKEGRITIVVPPKSTLSLEDMQAELKAAGVPTAKDTDETVIQNLYYKICK